MMLRKGNNVPEPILKQVIDFTTNFTDVCHHSKEEKVLFPALAESRMPTNNGSNSYNASRT
ncbi:MAG: cation-binding protein [Cenarchaeum symbiont of Oopsacas minuta]|nr:cation-binding protein [Cenarchaeum symbiont of Oopsacas minuta]